MSWFVIKGSAIITSKGGTLMARPKKKGLDYFPLDVYFINDRKLRPVKRTYGADGILIYIQILCMIYRDEGYFVRADDDFYGDIADELGMKTQKVTQVVNFLVKRSLFDDKLFNTDKILTSTGIQSRFQEATIKRWMDAGSIDKSFWLLSEEETMEHIFGAFEGVISEKTPVISEKTRVITEKSTQSKVKESKEKEIKENEIIIIPLREGRKTKPTFDEVAGYAESHGYTNVNVEKFYLYFIERGKKYDTWQRIIGDCASGIEGGFEK